MEGGYLAGNAIFILIGTVCVEINEKTKHNVIV
jgi:hypothetical protein